MDRWIEVVELCSERASGEVAGGRGMRRGWKGRVRGRKMAILRLGKIDVQMRHHVITSTKRRERYLAV